MLDRLIEEERKLAILHDLLVEMKDELSGDWHIEPMDNKKRRKVVSKEEYRGDYDPPVEAPDYETGMVGYEW